MPAIPPDEGAPLEVSQGYRPPVSQLLALGPVDETEVDYAALGIRPEHSLELYRMVIDPLLGRVSGPMDEPPAPMHAWRAICQLDLFEVLIGLLDWFDTHAESNEHWFWNDLAWRLVEVSDKVIAPMAGWVLKEPPTVLASVECARGLGEFGKWNPEFIPQCATPLMMSLERYVAHTQEFNAQLIISLVELRYVDAAPLIKKAYDAGAVDLHLVAEWEEVEKALKTPLEIDEMPDVDPDDLSEEDLKEMERTGMLPLRFRDFAIPPVAAPLPDFALEEPYRAIPEPGRNDPCPCGSGKKYKKCCGK